jgi:hypothetical protein
MNDSSGEDRSPAHETRQRDEPDQDETPVSHRRTPDGPQRENSPEVDDSADAYDPGPFMETLGNTGIYLGVLSVGLAASGLLLGTFRIQPIASLAILLSLVLITVSMILGAVFQAFGTEGTLFSR